MCAYMWFCVYDGGDGCRDDDADDVGEYTIILIRAIELKFTNNIRFSGCTTCLY